MKFSLFLLLLFSPIIVYSETFEFGVLQYANGNDANILRKYEKKDDDFTVTNPYTTPNLKFKDLIFLGDEIQTNTSTIKIRFAENALLVIYPNSSLEILENQQWDNKLFSTIKLKSGSVRIINKPSKSPEVNVTLNIGDIIIPKLKGEILASLDQIYNLKLNNSYSTIQNNSEKTIKEAFVLDYKNNQYFQNALDDNKILELNNQYPKPTESYFTIEIKTDLPPKPKNHLIDIGFSPAFIRLKPFFASKPTFQESNDSYTQSSLDTNTKKVITTSAGAMLRYSYRIFEDYRLGFMINNGQLNDNINHGSGEKDTYSEQSLFISRTVTTSKKMWASFILGHAELKFKNYDQNTNGLSTMNEYKYDYAYDGLIIGLMLEKQWKIFWGFVITASTKFDYFYLKLKDNNNTYIPYTPPKTLTAERLSAGLYLGYNFSIF